MVHKLENYPLKYEKLPNDIEVLFKKIKSRTRSFKLKAIRGGWLAQVRPIIDGERKEIVELAPSPREAVERLDKSMERQGLYEVKDV